jgi:hypothetical protein
VGDAFHQAAVAQEDVGVVVDDAVAGTVELTGQGAFRQGETHGIGDALSQGAGGGFNTVGVAVLRVARGLRVQLAELLQLFDRQIVAG